MKRNLLLTLMALALSLAAHAQTTWWGLWNTGLSLQPFTSYTSGSTDLYLRLTSKNSPLLAGGSVSGLRFWVADKTELSAVSVWMSDSYSRGSAPTIVRQEVAPDALSDWVHDGAPTVVRFDEAVSILPATNPYASVFVGITLQARDDRSITLLGSADGSMANSYYRDGTDVTATYGRLPLQVLAAGPLIPAEGAVAGALIDEQTALAGQPAVLSLSVTAAGAAPVSSLDYVVSVDGEPQPEQHCPLAEPIDELGKTFQVAVGYDVPAAPAKHRLSVSLTRVNDTPLANATPAEGTLCALSRPCTKRTVMEEFTGSWCHNCVRGIAGISRLQEQFADRFIAVAIHSSDPMQVDDYRNTAFYSAYTTALGGLPSCALDRAIGCDPYCGLAATGPFATDVLVDYALSQTAVADVQVEAHFADAQQDDISCRVTTLFAYDSDEAPYRLIIVLTADSLTGEGRDWQQVNGYNDYEGDDPYLLPFAGAGTRLADISYNHVAIDVAGADGGIGGSITAPLSHDAPQTFSHTLHTGSNALAQHKDRLHVVAMLIDTLSGRVVNAATTAVGQPTLGIAERTADAAATASGHFDLQGRRLQASPAKGTTIVNGKKRIINHHHH